MDDHTGSFGCWTEPRLQADSSSLQPPVASGRRRRRRVTYTHPTIHPSPIIHPPMIPTNHFHSRALALATRPQNVPIKHIHTISPHVISVGPIASGLAVDRCVPNSIFRTLRRHLMERARHTRSPLRNELTLIHLFAASDILRDVNDLLDDQDVCRSRKVHGCVSMRRHLPVFTLLATMYAVPCAHAQELPVTVAPRVAATVVFTELNKLIDAHPDVLTTYERSRTSSTNHDSS